jgi:hypothetical protein
MKHPRNKKLQAVSKIKDFFEDLRRNEHFLKQIKILRTSLRIPKDGFEPDAEDIKKLNKSSLFYWPRKLYKIDPSLWLGYIHKISVITDNILQSFPISNTYMDITLRTFVFHNKFLHELNISHNYLDTHNTVSISPSEDVFNEYAVFTGNKDSELEHIESVRKEINQYPVYIKISPEASRNDIVNFIDLSYTKNIKPILLHYRKKSPSILNRKSNKQNKNRERDDFIYANRHLSRKNIYSMLCSKKMGKNIDEAGVGKIISIETKKRNKV